jgi:hypothetical protein
MYCSKVNRRHCLSYTPLHARGIARCRSANAAFAAIAGQRADPVKRHRQIAKHGISTIGMPRLVVFRASDGALVIYDDVTRATRVAKLLPGQTVPIGVLGDLQSPGLHYPTVGDKLP